MRIPRRSEPVTPEPGPTAGEVERLRKQLRRARRQVREQKKRLDHKDKALARADEELEILRAGSLDIFPDIEIPSSLRQVMDAVRAENLTYLTPLFLESLVSCVLETEAAGREGLILEAGTALGGSAIAMAAAKDPARPMRVYDVFGMIPEPSEADGADVVRRYDVITSGRSRGLGGDTYYGYREDLLGEVAESFRRHGVPPQEHAISLVQGLFEDTMHLDEPVALAHVDGDWYESTMTCLVRITPHLVEGGRIVIDDYYMWSGCRRAVDEFFADRDGFRIERRAKVHIVRDSSSR